MPMIQGFLLKYSKNPSQLLECMTEILYLNLPKETKENDWKVKPLKEGKLLKTMKVNRKLYLKNDQNLFAVVN